MQLEDLPNNAVGTTRLPQGGYLLTDGLLSG